MAEDLLVDAATLREQVRDKYREVATDPHRGFHFHTGRPLAARLGYDNAVVDALPDRAVESFAGVGNPFSLRRLQPGERVVDVGSGIRGVRLRLPCPQILTKHPREGYRPQRSPRSGRRTLTAQCL